MRIYEDFIGDWVIEFDDGEEAGRASNMTEREALEAFAVNWPDRADEIMAEDLCGAREVRPRRVSQRGATDRMARTARRGSGARFRELIMAGKTNQEALDAVRAEFPESKATLTDAAWNRRELAINPDGFNADGTRRGPRRRRPSATATELSD